MFGTGWPANAGGRLVGSLAALPYALAEAEQNFLIPTREQALIWGDLVPQMILSAMIPRWWNVTPLQLHWVGLHMAYAETLLAEGALDTAAPAAGAGDARSLCAAGAAQEDRGAAGLRATCAAAEENVVPSEMYLLADDAGGERSANRRSPREIRRHRDRRHRTR